MDHGAALVLNSPPHVSRHDFSDSQVIAIRYVQQCLLARLTIFPVTKSGIKVQELTFSSIRAVFATFGIFGLAGSMFVIVSFIIFPHLRSFNKKLVLCLAIADLLSSEADTMSFGFFNPKLHSDGTCTAQAVLIQYSEVSSFVWSLIIAVHLYACAVHNIADETSKRLMPLYAVFGFVVPGMPVLVLSIKNAFGNSVIGTHITWYALYFKCLIAKLFRCYHSLLLFQFFHLQILILRFTFLHFIINLVA